MAYYIARNEKVSGPFTDGQVKSGLKSGKLKNADLISKSENGPWKSIGQALESSRPAKTSVPVPSEPDQVHELEVIEYDELQPLPDDGFAFPEEPTIAPSYVKPAQTKACPFCAEQIAAAAIKCKHCGEILNGQSSSSGTKQSVSGGFQTNRNVASDNEIRAAVQNMNTSRKTYYQKEFTELRDNGESFKATWNWYSFLFGVFWYAVAGLWVKAVIMLLACIVLAGIPAPFFWIYCGAFGNYDLYLKKVKNKDLW